MNRRSQDYPLERRKYTTFGPKIAGSLCLGRLSSLKEGTIVMVLDVIIAVAVVACGYLLIRTWPSIRRYYKISRM